MEYVLVIHRAENGGYRAEVPALKGCLVEADTLDGLLADAPNAITSYLEALAKEGREAPTGEGIIIATVTTSEAPAIEGHRAHLFLRHELGQYRTPTIAGAPVDRESSESESASQVPWDLRGRLAEWARVAAAVLALWVFSVGGYVLWNALDGRDVARGPGAGVAAAAASKGAAQGAPTTAPTATAVRPYVAATVAPAVSVSPTPVASPVAAPFATPTTIPAAARTAWSEYRVQPGETLWSISQKFGLTVEEVMKANDLTDRTFVMSGQRLLIPEARR